MGWLWKTAKSSASAMLNPPEAFGTQSLGSWIGPEDWHNYPLAASIASVAVAPLELFSRTFNAAATEVGTTVAGKERGEQFAQVLGDPGLAASLEGAGPIGEVAGGALQILNKFRPAEAWLKNGREPPAGVMPELDKIAADTNKQGVDQLRRPLVKHKSPSSRPKPRTLSSIH